MRLLHTADWHLGRSFHGADLSGAHQRVLDHLVEVAESEQPDVIVVAGDVFDRAYPPLDAVELYDETVARLAALGRPVVITSGNHDSAIRLGVHARVAEAARIHVRTRAGRVGEPVEVSGADGSPGLLVYAIPYLDPPSIAVGLDAEPTHSGVLGAALARIAEDRSRRPGIPAVVVAHGVVLGAAPIADEGVSTVERSIAVGGVSAVPAHLFEGSDYVALGHLHRPQTLAGGRVRYSGAPLAFGFDEEGDAKSISMVTLSAGDAPRIEEIGTPVPRAIARLTGSLEELLADAAHAHAENAWVEATLTDRLRPKLAMDQLRRRFPHVLKLEHRPEGRDLEGRSTDTYRERVRGRSETQIAAQFLAEVRGGIDADDAEQQLLAEALEAFAREEALQ